jgi:hypothetical protein
MELRVLAIGDIVGRPGREIISRCLSNLVQRHGIDFVIANAENASGGSGITPKEADELFKQGIDVLTAGDHVWAKKDIVPYIHRQIRLLRPANYPQEAPGRGASMFVTSRGISVGVIHVQGRIYMGTPADCPFKTARRWAEEFRKSTSVILLDMHAEATSEKIAIGWYMDGVTSFVFGTHTHVQTADERILPHGTAYITDIGMTGPYDSIIGRRIDRVLHKFITQMPSHFEVATNNVWLCGAMVTIQVETGQAIEIKRIALPSL